MQRQILKNKKYLIASGILFLFQNCISMTTCDPLDIIANEKIKLDQEKDKRNLPFVKLNFKNFDKNTALDNMDNYYSGKLPIDPSSPVKIEIEYLHKPMIDSFLTAFLARLPTPTLLTEIYNYKINLEFNNQKITKNYEFRSYLLLPFPVVSTFSFGLFSVGRLVKERESFREAVLNEIQEDLIKIAPPEAYMEPQERTVFLSNKFKDKVVLKNGDVLENVNALVAMDELIVTEPNGKKTTYKKSQLISINIK
jgi:hypothetical protein